MLFTRTALTVTMAFENSHKEPHQQPLVEGQRTTNFYLSTKFLSYEQFHPYSIFEPSILLIYCFQSSTHKDENGILKEMRLLIANHLDQSIHLTNQDQMLAKMLTQSLFTASTWQSFIVFIQNMICTPTML